MKPCVALLYEQQRALRLAAIAIAEYDDCVNLCPVRCPCGFKLGVDNTTDYCVPRIVEAFEKRARGES